MGGDGCDGAGWGVGVVEPQMRGEEREESEGRKVWRKGLGRRREDKTGKKMFNNIAYVTT